MKVFFETIKNYLVLIQIFKVHIKIYNIGDIQDLKLSATKMVAVLNIMSNLKPTFLLLLSRQGFCQNLYEKTIPFQ